MKLELSSIANYEETGNASYVTAFNQNFSIIEEKVLQNRISILDSVICIVFAVLVLLYPPLMFQQSNLWELFSCLTV